MILGVTGHRPDKLGGYRSPNAVELTVKKEIDAVLEELAPSCVITGMALGTDQWVAEACVSKGISFVAAIPFSGYEGKWPAHAQAKYQQLISKATAAYIISPGQYEAKKLFVRNQWIVSSCDLLFAVWDGSDDGGTSSCVNYAKQVQKPIRFANLAPEVWEMAKLVNPKASAMATKEQEAVVLSNFLSTVKEKSEKLAQEKLKEQQALFEKKMAMAKLAAMPPPKPPTPKLPDKTSIQGFGRVIDLEEDS